LRRVWAIVLAFLLVIGVLASSKVLAALLGTIVGGTVTVGDGTDTLWLYVESDDLRITEWNPIGTTPYLNAVDYNINYISTQAKNKIDGDYYFADSGKSTQTIINVTVQIYGMHSLTNKQLEVFVWDGSSYTSLGLQTLPTSWSWMNYTATTVLDTWAKIDGAKIYLKSSDNGATYYVDCARLQVDYDSTS